MKKRDVNPKKGASVSEVLALLSCNLDDYFFKIRIVNVKKPISGFLTRFNSFVVIKDLKRFHDAMEMCYGSKHSGATPLLSADETTLFVDKDAILLDKHINSVPNRSSTINDNAIN